MFELRQYTLLLLTALIWGSGFIGQKLGMDHISPFAFTFFRTMIGGLFLLPIIASLNYLSKKSQKQLLRKSNKHSLLLGSVCCGICLITAESLQQFGLVTTEVNKASFVTSMYVLFVPIFSIVLGQRLGLKICLCVLISVLGLYLLCMKGQLSLEQGDFLVLLGAMVFAVHILVIAYFVQRADGVMLSCGQFFVASLLGLVMMFVSGSEPTAEQLRLAAPAFIYTGIMSNGVAYTLQIVGQRGINSTVATLIMSLESVFGAILGVLWLNEQMTLPELIGGALMFIAVVISQLPDFSRRRA